MAVLFFTQLYSWFPHGLKKSHSPYEEYGSYLEEIRETFGRKMFEEFSLIPQGGSGKMHEKVEVIGMGFTAHRRATIEEARALQLILMNRFVQEVNRHEKIQPFLEINPITYKRICIEISYTGRNGIYSDGSVERTYNVDDTAGAVENRNRLFYFANDPFTNKSYDLFEESYEEAIKLANTLNFNPYAHETSVLEFNIDQMFSSFVQKMRQKHHLEKLSIGGKINPNIEEIGARFTLVKKTTQEEARAVLLTVVDKLLQTINTDDHLRNYLVEYPFPLDRLKIGINFTKKNYHSYWDGSSMESVTLVENEITYYQNPSADALWGPLATPIFAKESYQEALKIVDAR